MYRSRPGEEVSKHAGRVREELLSESCAWLIDKHEIRKQKEHRVPIYWKSGVLFVCIGCKANSSCRENERKKFNINTKSSSKNLNSLI